VIAVGGMDPTVPKPEYGRDVIGRMALERRLAAPLADPAVPHQRVGV
jgi:hypothetical protein